MENKRKGMSEIVSSKHYASDEEIAAYQKIYKMLAECPIPCTEMLANMGLFLNRSSLSHILFIDSLYRRIINIHGVIIEFGVRWGRNLALLIDLRTIYEPYNYGRKIIGFDTFEGFPSVSTFKNGIAEAVSVGALSVTPEYPTYLENLLSAHETLGPRSHIKKFELIKGDVVYTLESYLEKYPETIIALAYFDMDLYDPTKKCLEIIKNHVTKGSVLAFDELGLHEFPGETLAFQEVFKSTNYKICSDPNLAHQAFFVVE